MVLEFSGETISWRGPAPYVFVPVPPDLCAEIKDVAALVTYGWGVIPVTVRIGATETTTSLFPKDGRYLVPIKKIVQNAESLNVGDRVLIRLELEPRPSSR